MSIFFFLGQEPVSRRSRKVVAPQKPQQNLKLYAWLQRHFIFIQNVSDLYTSKLLDKEKLKIALQVQKDSWALEKWVQALRSESFWKYCGTFVDRGNIYYLLIFSICQFDRHFDELKRKIQHGFAWSQPAWKSWDVRWKSNRLIGTWPSIRVLKKFFSIRQQTIGSHKPSRPNSMTGYHFSKSTISHVLKEFQTLDTIFNEFLVQLMSWLSSRPRMVRRECGKKIADTLSQSLLGP